MRLTREQKHALTKWKELYLNYGKIIPDPVTKSLKSGKPIPAFVNIPFPFPVYEYAIKDEGSDWKLELTDEFLNACQNF